MQLHFYVPDEVAAEVRRSAEAKGLSVSAYVAWVVSREVRRGWPERYFESVVGGWEGEPLERSPQGELEAREDL
jgi:hypothetical protein